METKFEQELAAYNRARQQRIAKGKPRASSGAVEQLATLVTTKKQRREEEERKRRQAYYNSITPAKVSKPKPKPKAKAKPKTTTKAKPRTTNTSMEITNELRELQRKAGEMAPLVKKAYELGLAKSK